MKEKNGEHPYGDAGQLILLALFLVVWVGDSFFLHVSTFLSNQVHLYIRLAISSLALVAAVSLFKSGHVVAHERRPAGVVSTGAFRYVRHPLYLAGILFYFGLSVSTASLLSLTLLAMIFVFYDYIAGYEEKLLEMKYGERYSSYRRRTGKWLPRIGKNG